MSFSIVEMMFWNVSSERSPSVDAITVFQSVNIIILHDILNFFFIKHYGMFM